jgi:hypothetical protein
LHSDDTISYELERKWYQLSLLKSTWQKHLKNNHGYYLQKLLDEAVELRGKSTNTKKTLEDDWMDDSNLSESTDQETEEMDDVDDDTESVCSDLFLNPPPPQNTDILLAVEDINLSDASVPPTNHTEINISTAVDEPSNSADDTGMSNPTIEDDEAIIIIHSDDEHEMEYMESADQSSVISVSSDSSNEPDVAVPTLLNRNIDTELMSWLSSRLTYQERAVALTFVEKCAIDYAVPTSFPLQFSSLKRLHERDRFLNDECLESAFDAVKEHLKDAPRIDNTTVFPQYLFRYQQNSTLYRPHSDLIWQHSKSTEYWTKSHWIFPIHKPREFHFILCCINRQEHHIWLFDSFSKSDWSEDLQDIQQLLIKLFRNAKKHDKPIQLPTQKFKIERVLVSMWIHCLLIYIECYLQSRPVQHNTVDCGAWTIATTISYIRGYDMPGINESNMADFRRLLLDMIAVKYLDSPQ